MCSNQNLQAMEAPETGACDCCLAAAQKKPAAAKSTLRSIPSVMLSVLIAFFPKCPICWAAYMSMFGSFGLAKTPYMDWLFPVLLAFLGLHLLLLLKKAPQKGYGPFLLSLGGALFILGGRSLFPAAEWVLFAGMLFILSGSLWNSFSFRQLKMSLSH